MTVKNVRSELKKHKIEALLILSNANSSYFTQTTSRDSYVLVTRRKNFFITDSRYTEEAKSTLGKDFRVRLLTDSLPKTLLALCQELKIRTLGFEEQYTTYALYAKLRLLLASRTRLVPLQGVIEQYRQVKTPGELKKMKIACAITVEAFKYAQKIIAPGKKELEVAAELERFIRLKGARAASFDIIIASGPNSSFPHHLTSERKLRANEPVLIDMGVDYLGYKSDLTRVLFLGKITPLVHKIYQIALHAQQEAIRQIKPGVSAKAVDSFAREIITGRGYGQCFGHNLGHGVGLEVHEAPRISPKEERPIAPGMIFTVEPGIYLPGKFGVRIEDMVLCTKKGVEVLSGSLNK